MARPFETYSKRNSTQQDVLSYDTIKKKLRNQIYHIWNDFFYGNNLDEKLIEKGRQKIFDIICAEEGLKTLHYDGHFMSRNAATMVDSYFEDLDSTDRVLDAIEIVFHTMAIVERVHVENYRSNHPLQYTFQSSVEDLNRRFFENSMGYQYEAGKIVKVSSKLLHQEITKKAFEILKATDFENANEEFIKAHEHFRHSRFKECLNESLKAFESTLKILIAKNGWHSDEKDTASALIKIAVDNKLLPTYLQSSFSGIRTILECSIPTIRNKNSGHGQGTKKVIVPGYLASYMLYLTGATIVFLIDANGDKPT